MSKRTETRTFRMTAEAVAGLKKLAEMHDKSQSDIIQMLIQSKIDENTKPREAASEILGMLQNELNIKNQQISDITAALVAAQQTAATAQALHAGTIKTHLTDSEADPQKKGLFSRIFKRR